MSDHVRDRRADPFIRVDKKAFEILRDELDAPAMAVYLALAYAANGKTGESWHKIETLEQQAQVSRATLYRRLNDLEAVGLIQIDNQTDHHGLTCNLYTLLDAPAQVPPNWRELPRPARRMLTIAYGESGRMVIDVRHPLNGRRSSPQMTIDSEKTGATPVSTGVSQGDTARHDRCLTLRHRAVSQGDTAILIENKKNYEQEGPNDEKGGEDLLIDERPKQTPPELTDLIDRLERFHPRRDRLAPPPVSLLHSSPPDVQQQFWRSYRRAEEEQAAYDLSHRSSPR